MKTTDEIWDGITWDAQGNPLFRDYSARIYYYRISDDATFYTEYWPVSKPEAYRCIERFNDIYHDSDNIVYLKSEIINIFQEWQYDRKYGYCRDILESDGE